MLRWLDSVRPTLVALCAQHSVPLGVTVGWIEKESGGNIGEVTSLDERGFFQLMPDESRELGLDHDRLSSDVNYSLEAGLKLIDLYRKRVLAVASGRVLDFLQSPDAKEYLFRLVKFFHSIGAGAGRMIFDDAIALQAADSWAALSEFAIDRDEKYFAELKHRPSKWIAFVDEVFDIGAPYGIGALGVS